MFDWEVATGAVEEAGADLELEEAPGVGLPNLLPDPLNGL